MTPLAPHDIHTRPPAALVAAVRNRHGLTQEQCASAVGTKPRTWQRYESAGGSMALGIWWCFLMRVGEISEGELPPIPERQRAEIKKRTED